MKKITLLYNVGFAGPFIGLRWRFLELSYRGLVGDSKGDGPSYGNQIISSFYFATSNRYKPVPSSEIEIAKTAKRYRSIPDGSPPPDIDMVFVKGGAFTMGCTGEQQSDCNYNEQPTRSVTVSDFYIGKYEVTQSQWVAVMGNNPSRFRDDNRPVEIVSWYDVQKFIVRLNSITGRNYRLPTEAEWEYAARGGSSSNNFKYAGSSSVNDVAWYQENSAGRTRPVGIKEPNELGIYDMSGNVREWVRDWPVIRGGSWNTDSIHCRVSDRSNDFPHYGDFILSNDLGFRLALDP
jgi:formylglycine-generating enzyme required for sulfatase activity